MPKTPNPVTCACYHPDHGSRGCVGERQEMRMGSVCVQCAAAGHDKLGTATCPVCYRTTTTRAGVFVFHGQACAGVGRRPEAGVTEEPRREFVYIDYGTEHNPNGATLCTYPDGSVLEQTRDKRLIDESVASTDGPGRGIVCAYLGVDGHWHFDHHLSLAEIKKERL